MKKVFFISIVAGSFLTGCRQWYSLQNFLGFGHYEIVSNAENWLDNNRYDSISQKWIGPDSARINYIDAEANKIEMNKKDYKNNNSSLKIQYIAKQPCAASTRDL